MKTTTKNTGIKVTTNVKAGGFAPGFNNHNRKILKVATGLKAGKMIPCANHSRRVLSIV